MERREFVTSLVGSAAATGLVGSATGTALAGSHDPLEEIEILTDEYDESHVYADDVYSLAYGNGYVQAGDRLFLMDVVRHIGYGDSATVLGPGQIPSDIQVKRDLYSVDEIERQWEEAPDRLRTAIRGYTDGVNRRMVELAGQGELPAEFAALGHAPEPWKPEDSVAAINYLIGFFGVSGGNELSNAMTLARLEESLGSLREAYDAYGDLNWLRTPDDHFTSIPERDVVVDGGEEVLAFEDVPGSQLHLVDAVWTDGAVGEEFGVRTWGIEADVAIPQAVTEGRREGAGVMEGFKWGSNAIVVHGDLTETGEPMLGGGPQMGYFKPPVPYEIGLHGDGFDVTGIGVVAAPAIVIGRNAGSSGSTADDGSKSNADGSGSAAAGTDGRDALAYTVTSGRDDMVDTVAVELDPDDRHRYRWEGQWYEMETHRVTHVASPVVPTLTGSPGTRVVEQEVARIHPPGVDRKMPVVAWNPDPAGFDHPVAWAQRVTTRGDELDGSFVWSEIGRATDLDDFEETFAEFPFTFNFHLVSESGDIAYVHTGKVPLREGEADYRLPRTPEQHDWNGTFYTQQGAPTDPENRATVVRNPSTGYVVNWNNCPASGWRAGDGEQNWGSIHRVEELDHWVRERLDAPGNVPDHSIPETARGSLSVVDVKELISQAALHDASAQTTVPYLIDAARGASGSDAPLDAMADELEAWLDSYCAWHDEYPSEDRQTTEDEDVGDAAKGFEPRDGRVVPTDGDDVYVHAGHAIYDEARTRLQELVFADELGDQLSAIDFDPPASLHAAQHGEVFDDVTFADALAGETTHDWFDDVTRAGTQTRDDLLVQALEAAATTLTEEFDSADPADWLMDVHESTFLSIGVGETETMDMRNRSSYNQAIEIVRAQREPGADVIADAERVGEWADYAGDVLPPANSGHVTAPEFMRAQASGSEPERMSDQLPLYVNNVYKPHPVTRKQVEDVATSSRTIRPTVQRSDAPLTPAESLPPDALAGLVGGPSPSAPADAGDADAVETDGDDASSDSAAETGEEDPADDPVGDATDPVADDTGSVADGSDPVTEGDGTVTDGGDVVTDGADGLQ